MTAVMERTPRIKRPSARKQDTLLVIDDHPVIFEGFRRLANEIGIATVLEAGDIVTGYSAFHSHKPRLVVTDLYFEEGGLSGLTLIRQMRASNPASHILVFSETDDPIIVAHALKAGARGFALKHSPIATLLDALATVRAGRGYLPHDIATKIAMLDAHEHLEPLASLTAREMQILSLIGQGKSNREIVEILSIKYRSLISVTSNIRMKLRVDNLVELIKLAQSRIDVRD
jgi:DNA-binding NarL/FixJ family response regulator